MRTISASLALVCLAPLLARADLPTASYIFPAGAQRGTAVAARIGGCNLHRAPHLHWISSGVTAPRDLQPIETIWFEGPVIPQPASQQKEDYPRDFAATLAIADDAPLGDQAWRLSTSQGITAARGFIIGTFPEVVEQEVEGTAPAVHVDLPVTINGRIFPREDIDVWSFHATAGQRICCRAVTSAFGSPLDARIEIRDSMGNILAEQVPEGTVTPDLVFTAPTEGEYQVRIHDVGFGGLQDHVYRLTVTAGPVLTGAFPLGGRRGAQTVFQLEGINLSTSSKTVTLPQQGSEFKLRMADDPSSFGAAHLDLDDLPEFLEADSGEQTVAVPCVLNGQIEAPGDTDSWLITAKKGVEYDFEVRASRLGSMLDAVIEIADSQGKKLTDADDSQGLLTDARLRWTAPADGDYRLTIRDRLTSRGGSRFAYRIRATSTDLPEFTLTAAVDSVVIERGKTANVKITLDRGPGFKEPVVLNIDGLPAGVSVTAPASPITIAANQREVQVTLKAESTCKADVTPLRMSGRASVGRTEIIRPVELRPTSPEPGSIVLPDGSGTLWLAVAVPTPFKFVGIFETKYIPRGSVFVRKYHVDRNGFEGPLEVRLADRQGRHLQGVTAQSVLVPPGASDFEIGVKLAPWMEIGRTCRSTLAVSGVVTDADGTTHDVSYSSNDQNNQMIALVDPGRFAIQLGRPTLTATPGKQIDIPIRIQRSPEFNGPVSVKLITTPPVQGVTSEPIEVAANANQSALRVTFGDQLSGVDVHPVTIQATTKDERGMIVTAEASLTLVPER